MINAHPMVKGSFASNPSSVRVYKAPQQHHNGNYAAAEHLVDRKRATLGCSRLAIALHRAMVKAEHGDEAEHLDCIAIHEATIERLTRRVR